MANEKGKRSKRVQTKGGDNPSFEEKKRAAYSAMGKLGGLARAKQMAEKGFERIDALKDPSKRSPEEKAKDLKGKNFGENKQKK